MDNRIPKIWQELTTLNPEEELLFDTLIFTCQSFVKSEALPGYKIERVKQTANDLKSQITGLKRIPLHHRGILNLIARQCGYESYDSMILKLK